MAWKNLEDQRKYEKEWYKKNRARRIELSKKNKERITAFIRQARTACAKCGEDHPACLDFHHIDSKTKAFSIANAANRGVSLKRLQAEIDKCVVLCSNCHRKLHASES